MTRECDLIKIIEFIRSILVMWCNLFVCLLNCRRKSEGLGQSQEPEEAAGAGEKEGSWRQELQRRIDFGTATRAVRRARNYQKFQILNTTFRYSVGTHKSFGKNKRRKRLKKMEGVSWSWSVPGRLVSWNEFCRRLIIGIFISVKCNKSYYFQTTKQNRLISFDQVDRAYVMILYYSL